MPDDVDALVEYYRDLIDADDLLFGSASWSVVLAGEQFELPTFLRGFEALDRRVSCEELVSLAYGSGDEFPTATFVWLISSGIVTGMLEPNGGQSSDPRLLRRLSLAGALVFSAIWNDDASTGRLCVATDGGISIADLEETDTAELAAVANSANIRARISDVYALTQGESYAVRALATVQILSGFRLDKDLLAGEWPALRFGRAS